jgi:hypothetical protein
MIPANMTRPCPQPRRVEVVDEVDEVVMNPPWSWSQSILDAEPETSLTRSA